MVFRGGWSIADYALVEFHVDVPWNQDQWSWSLGWEVLHAAMHRYHASASSWNTATGGRGHTTIRDMIVVERKQRYTKTTLAMDTFCIDLILVITICR